MIELLNSINERQAIILEKKTIVFQRFNFNNDNFVLCHD